MKSNEQRPRTIEGKVALHSMQQWCVATLGQMSCGRNWPIPRPAHIPLLHLLGGLKFNPPGLTRIKKLRESLDGVEKCAARRFDQW